MTNDQMRTIVETGLKRHALVDQCGCSQCVEDYGPGGAPGRCGHCRDSAMGTVCAERSAYLALHSLLDKMDQVIPQHMKQEDCPWCAKQFCVICNKVVRYDVNPNNPPDHCPRCGERDLELRGVRHQSLVKAADHRMAHRLEQKEQLDETRTFTRLSNGQWAVKGRGLKKGQEVTVERRDGDQTTVVLGEILDTDEFGKSVALIAWRSWDA